MAQELLNRAQVGAAFEQVRREGVPQSVRMGEQPPERARVEPPSARGEEERVLRAPGELRPGVAQVDGEAVRGFLSQRHDALLVALPTDVK